MIQINKRCYSTAFKRLGIAMVLVLVLGIAITPIAQAQEIAELWAALARGGHVALMRHALAPGTGDPAYFDLQDCSTQRNLSEEGREQARRIGQNFRAHGISIIPVYSSQWCRCLETARLFGLGPVKPLPALNSFFRDRSRETEQTAAVHAFIKEHAAGPSMVLVTHQVNITALTGLFPQSGEIIVLRPKGSKLEVLGRITP